MSDENSNPLRAHEKSMIIRESWRQNGNTQTVIEGGPLLIKCFFFYNRTL